MKATNVICCSCGNEWIAKKGKTVVLKSSVPYGGSATPAPHPPLPVPQKRQVSATREYDFMVPLLVAGASGVLAFLTIQAFIARFWAAGASLCVTDLVWVIVLFLFVIHRYELMRQLTYRAEAALGMDLDGDNQVGEPASPGRTIIESSGNKRPRFWRNLTANKQQDDRIAFAYRCFERQVAEMGIGQAAMKDFRLPSGFKCGRLVHAQLAADLVEIGAAHRVGKKLVIDADFESVVELTDFIRDKITVGE